MKIGNQEREQVKALTDGKRGLAAKAHLLLSFKNLQKCWDAKLKEDRLSLLHYLTTDSFGFLDIENIWSVYKKKKTACSILLPVIY